MPVSEEGKSGAGDSEGVEKEEEEEEDEGREKEAVELEAGRWRDLGECVGAVVIVVVVVGGGGGGGAKTSLNADCAVLSSLRVGEPSRR